MDYEKKWAVVTGASKGIGKAICLALSKKKMSICLISRSEALLNKVAIECKDNGASDTQVYTCDFGDKNSVEELAAKVLKDIGSPEVLVNNAGTYVPGSPLEGDCDKWDEMMQINLLSPMRLTRLLLPGMADRMSGCLINIGSVAGQEAMSGQSAAYAAVKHGMSGWSRSSYLTLRHKNIKTCLIQPALVNTELVTLTSADSQKMIQPEDIANYCIFILESSAGCVPEEIVLRLSLSPFSSQS